MKKLAMSLALISMFGASEVMAQATVTEIPIVVAGVFSCNGENVVLEGTFKMVDHLRSDGNGGFHYTSNWNIKANGSGDLGNEYRLNTSDNFGFNAGSDGLPYTENWQLRENIIGKGKAPNAQFVIKGRTTVNNNGDVTVDVFETELICR